MQEPEKTLRRVFEAAAVIPKGAPPFFDHAATLTDAFDLPKVGHFIGQGPAVCGNLVIKDIGLENWLCFEKTRDDFPAFVLTENGPAGALRPVKTRLLENEPSVRDLRGRSHPYFFYPKKKSVDHKYSHGHTLVLSGPSGKGGAARLAARGALRIGAGLVTVGVPHAALAENAAQLNAVMLSEIEDSDALERVLKDERINALCLGPGLGLERAREVVPVALRTGRSCVLDADALSIFENNEEDLFALLHDRVVLTPHGGEFGRLFPDIAEKLAAPATKGPAYSKVDATREAAARAGCIVLFKGADTVIAAPDGRCAINSAHYERAAPWLATAGSGDVLAGFIAGLLARGFDPMQAAETGAWLHVECALGFGPGLIAEDLPEQLPEVFRKLGL